jgi:hypothetical protein
MLVREPGGERKQRLIEAIFFDFHCGYRTGGELEVLDWRRSRYTGGEIQLENYSVRAEWFRRISAWI